MHSEIETEPVFFGGVFKVKVKHSMFPCLFQACVSDREGQSFVKLGVSILVISLFPITPPTELFSTNAEYVFLPLSHGQYQ